MDPGLYHFFQVLPKIKTNSSKQLSNSYLPLCWEIKIMILASKALSPLLLLIIHCTFSPFFYPLSQIEKAKECCGVCRDKSRIGKQTYHVDGHPHLIFIKEKKTWQNYQNKETSKPNSLIIKNGCRCASSLTCILYKYVCA